MIKNNFEIDVKVKCLEEGVTQVQGYIWTPDTQELICGGNDNEPEWIGRQVLEMMGRLRNEHILHMTSDKHKKYVLRSLCKGYY